MVLVLVTAMCIYILDSSYFGSISLIDRLKKKATRRPRTSGFAACVQSVWFHVSFSFFTPNPFRCVPNMLYFDYKRHKCNSLTEERKFVGNISQAGSKRLGMDPYIKILEKLRDMYEKLLLRRIHWWSSIWWSVQLFVCIPVLR